MPRDLSVLIPARNERWLARTVEDVLEHAQADTEVIAILDGSWPDPPLADRPGLRLYYTGTPIGQRAAVNLAARLSDATYVMKLDAHCAVAPGFDAALIEAARELGPDVTQIPTQYNLHVFDWHCAACGHRQYQGPTPPGCPQCGGPVARDVVWRRRESRKTTAWRFDADLHFQYWRDAEKRQRGDLCDVLTSLGACFFMRRDRFAQLGGLDEAHGSWGQFGVEIALKSWLSGGRHVVNKRTWFAHLFRTQGGDFGFPYPMSGAGQDAARAYSQQLWLANAWPGQVRPLAWVLDHFAPVPAWHEPAGAARLAAVRAAAATFRAAPAVHTRPSKGCVYYSDCRGDERVLSAVRTQLSRAAAGCPIVAVTLKPVDLGRNIVLDRERGYLTMFEQILAGLEALDTDIAYLTEHDVLYAPEHFAFTPARTDTCYYNQHVWKVDAATGRALHYLCDQTSGLSADRRLLVEHYRRRVARVRAEGFTRSMGFEPGTRKTRHGGVDDLRHESWFAARPNVDIRHGHNLTPSRWRRDQFRDQRYTAGWTEAEAVPGWGQTAGRFDAFLAGVVKGA